jgi:hypothetical protein
VGHCPAGGFCRSLPIAWLTERTKSHGASTSPGGALHSRSDEEDKNSRLSMVLGDAELELFDSIELIASLTYLLQVGGFIMLYLRPVWGDRPCSVNHCFPRH